MQSLDAYTGAETPSQKLPCSEAYIVIQNPLDYLKVLFLTAYQHCFKAYIICSHIHAVAIYTAHSNFM